MTHSKKPHLSLRSPTGRSYFHARLSKRFARRFLAASFAILLFSALVGIWIHARELSRRGEVGQGFTLAPGPWGSIHARTVILPPPTDIFDPDFQLGNGKWHFKKSPPATIRAILRDSGLSQRQIATLLPTLAPVTGEPDLLTISPPAALVLELDQPTRSRLYSHLSELDANFAQAHPFRMAALHLDQWLQSPTIPHSLLQLVRSLLWRSGNTLMLSDYNIVAARIDNPSTRVALQSLLSRKISLRATLAIPRHTNLQQLAHYWSAGGRGQTDLPILQSASSHRSPPIDIIELLPPFARRHLNRFPDPQLHANHPPACHWSTFNFFNTGPPNDSFHTTKGVEHELQQNYTPLQSTPSFGDIILLNEPDGTSIHSAIFIADDIVFTKNGPSPATPWILSTIQEMRAFYPSNKHLTISYHRHKNHHPPPPLPHTEHSPQPDT